MKTFEQRFWAKVDTTGECWEWTASLNQHGYGQIGYEKTVLLAHRASFEIRNGPIQDGAMIDHLCHNRKCVNPDHLRVATPAENAQNRRGAAKHNTSGHRGVMWHEKAGKWRARAMKNGHYYDAGLFEDVHEAAKAAAELRERLYGEAA